MKTLGAALERAIDALKEVVRSDENVICVGFAMDALNRLASLHPEDAALSPVVCELRDHLPAILGLSPLQCSEALVRSQAVTGSAVSFTL